VLYENPVHEDGPDVLLLAQQLELQASLGLLVGLHVTGESVVRGAVVEHRQLQNVDNAHHGLGVVRPLPS